MRRVQFLFLFFLFSLTGFSNSWATGPCDDVFQHQSFKGNFDEENSKQQLLELLGTHPLHAVQIIQFLAEHPKLNHLDLQKLFDGPAGVSEGFSLHTHTQMVLNTFREQERFFNFTGLGMPADAKELVLFMLALHDIGKGLSLIEWSRETGNSYPSTTEEFKEATAKQHHYSEKIIVAVMNAFDFEERQKKIVIALVDNDYLGQVAVYNPETGRGISPETGLELLKEKAADAELPFSIYFRLKKYSLISDAASYPSLRYGGGFSEFRRPGAFRENKKGELTLTSKSFQRLEAKILGSE